MRGKPKPDETASSDDDRLVAVVGEFKRYGLTMLALSGAINMLGISLSLFIMLLFDRVLASRNLDTLAFLALAAALALMTAAALDGIRNIILGRAGEWLMQRLGPEVLARSIERRLVDSKLRTEMLREVSQLRGFIAGPGVPSILDIPWMPFYLLVAFLIHPWLGAISLLGMLLLFMLAWVNERLSNAELRASAELSARVLRDGDAIMRNAEVIDSMGMAPQITRRWARGMAREVAMQDRLQRRNAVLVSTTRLTRSLLQVGLYTAAALLVLDQQLTGGAMMAGSIIMSRLLAPMEAMFVHWRSLMLTREIYRHLQVFFDLPPLRSTATELPAPRGDVAVERVTLMRPGHVAPILRGVDFALEAGEHLAIVGPAASGKTTLLRIILGIMRPNQGAARLDGMDMCKWQRADLGRHVGYLPQDVELFDGTVAQNIARFTQGESSEIIRAARMAGCHQMILALPNGYDSEIGEGGLLLSGGQRQQLGLARALFGRPRLVVLDEPNSNLDTRGDIALKNALERLRAAGVTTIVVTHRQALIAHVDKLLVLQAGMIKAFGPVAQVLTRMRPEAKLPDRTDAETGVKTGGGTGGAPVLAAAPDAAEAYATGEDDADADDTANADEVAA